MESNKEKENKGEEKLKEKPWSDRGNFWST